MSDDQPSKPQSDLPSDTPGPGAGLPLASRLQRLAAAAIDSLINSLFILPIMLAMGVVDYMETGEPIPPNLAFQVAFAGFAVFLLVHGYLLYRTGQTIGKKLMKIAIVDLRGNVPSFNRMIGLRYLPFWFAGNVRELALIPIIDVMFIFRQDRRCLHDLLAGTRVIDVSSREGA